MDLYIYMIKKNLKHITTNQLISFHFYLCTQFNINMNPMVFDEFFTMQYDDRSKKEKEKKKRDKKNVTNRVIMYIISLFGNVENAKKRTTDSGGKLIVEDIVVLL